MHIARAVTDQEADNFGNFLRRGEAFDAGFACQISRGGRIIRAQFLGARLNAMRQAIGMDIAGIDEIDTHAIRHTAIRERLGEIHQRRIDRTTNGKICTRQTPADTTDIHNATVGFVQMRPCCAGQPHSAEQLQRITIRPIIIGKREEIAALGRPRAMDQNIQGAEALDSGFYRCFGGGIFAQVTGHHYTIRAAIGSNLLHICSATRQQHQLGAITRQGAGDGSAYPAACAADKRNLARKRRGHSAVIPASRMTCP